MVPVLVVTGPVGVGKSAVLDEADVLLIDAHVEHASVELDELARFWPPAGTQTRGEALTYRNLAAIWSNFAAAGAARLLLAGLVEQRSDLRYVSEAIRDAEITVVRLNAPLPVLEERIRGLYPDPDDELSGARWWAEHLDRARPEDHLIETDGRTPHEIARHVLRVAGWLR